MAKKRRGLRAKSEMNVVPYIDVMLVLLVIFMISAPLLNQAVEVDLPESQTAGDIEIGDKSAPLVVTIDRNGAYFIDRADDNTLPVSTDLIASVTRDILSKEPTTKIYIRADKNIDYGAVMVIIDVLRDSGAKAVGLTTPDPDKES